MSHPLIEQLNSRYGYPSLDAASVDHFTREQPFSVLFFAEDPKRFAESLDVAVILPELVRRFPQLSPAVIATKDERNLQGRYGFTAWPTLVFLKEGRYLGAISKVRNWDEYISEIEMLLAGEPRRDPGIGIPVVAGNEPAACGH